MTPAKTFKYRTNLARKMSAPGGRSVGEALQAADRGLAAHRDSAMEALGEILTVLETACAERRQAEIYDRAAALLDLSGFFDTGPLHPAVFSLCEISDQRSGQASVLPLVLPTNSRIASILASTRSSFSFDDGEPM